MLVCNFYIYSMINNGTLILMKEDLSRGSFENFSKANWKHKLDIYNAVQSGETVCLFYVICYCVYTYILTQNQRETGWMINIFKIT